MYSFFSKKRQDKNIDDVYKLMVNDSANNSEKIRPKQGPRNYNLETTGRLKDLMVMMLDENLQGSAEYSMNLNNEIEVFIGGRLFNITELLQNHPDFEHMTFDEEQTSKYKTIASQYDLSKLDLVNKEILNNVKRESGEKLAVFLYTTEMYKEIQEFLRHPTMDDNDKNEFIKKMKQMDKNLLGDYVARILLCTGMASFSLKTLSDSPTGPDQTSGETSEKNKPIAIRIEATNSIINEFRKKMIEDAKTSRFTGFVSTSLHDKYSPDGKDQKGKTIILIRDEGIGKIIEDVSNTEDEKEILFHPGTEVRFTAMHKIGNTTYFLADTVRSIDLEHLDQFTAEKREQNIIRKLYEKLLPMSEKNNQLSSLREKLAGLMNPDSLTEEKSNIRLSQIDFLEIAKEIQRLLKITLTPDEKIFLEYAQKNILSIQNETISKNLLPHIEYVYEEFFKKPYAINPELSDHVAKLGNTIIPRPNHGLAHVARTVSYLPDLVMFLSEHGNSQVKTFCKQMSEKDMELMQIAMLFFVSGRQSEESFRDNKSNYESFRKSRVDNFSKYVAKINQERNETISFSADDVEKFKFILSGVGDPSFPDRINNDKTIAIENKPFLVSVSILMDQAHNLDLLRCYDDKNSYQQATDRILASVEGGVENEKAKKDLDSIRTIAYQRICDTGDIAYFEWSANGAIKTTGDKQKYRENDFIVASTDPVGCMKKISLLSEDFLLPSLTSKAITIPPMTEDIANRLKEKFFELTNIFNTHNPEISEHTLNILHYIEVAYPEKIFDPDSATMLNRINKLNNKNIENSYGIEFLAKLVINPMSNYDQKDTIEYMENLAQYIPNNASNINFRNLMSAIHNIGGGKSIYRFTGLMSELKPKAKLQSIMTQLTNSELAKGTKCEKLIKELCGELENTVMNKTKIINIIGELFPIISEEKPTHATEQKYSGP